MFDKPPKQYTVQALNFMAKTNSNNTQKKNTNCQSYGTLPKDKLAQNKLNGNISSNRVISKNTKLVKKFVESIKHYRQYVHGVQTNKLCSSLKNTAHYFTLPMSRVDSDNPRDRRGLESGVEQGAE